MTRIDHLKQHTDSSRLEKDHCGEHALYEAVRKLAGSRFARFLRNVFALREEPNEIKGSDSTIGTEGKMPKRKFDKTKQDSLEAEKMGLRLRSKRATTTNSKFFDISSDDDLVYVKAKRQLRCRREKFIDSDTWESGRPKRACNKQKKFVDDDCLTSDGKEFYEKDDLLYGKTSEETPNKKTPIHRRTKISSPLKKCRATALSKLNDEAEHFLFPHKDESSTEEEADNRKLKHSIRETKASDTKLKLLKSEHHDETSMGSSCSDKSINRKKRRRTQAEAFIMDNEKYYKFEMLGSRLRYQGSYLAPLPPKGNHEDSKRLKRHVEYNAEENNEESGTDGLNSLKNKFSFEIIPKYESWYETFERQDHGDDMYYSYSSNSNDSKSFLLPYEVGPLAPLDPTICITFFNDYKKELLEDSPASLPSSTPDAIASLDGKSQDSIDEDSKSSEDKKEEEGVERPVNRKRGAKKRTVGGKNPRKSPRQHASTLAILSSLIQQRKRGRNTESLYKQTLPSIPEDKEAEAAAILSKDIDQFLATDPCEWPLDIEMDTNRIDSLEEDCEQINISCQTDMLHVMCDFENIKAKGSRESIAAMRTPRYLPGKKRYKRKKKKNKNRTGWPSRKNRRLKKDEEIKEHQGISEFDSTLDSPCFHADSEDNGELGEESSCSVDVGKLRNVRRASVRHTDADCTPKVNGEVKAVTPKRRQPSTECPTATLVQEEEQQIECAATEHWDETEDRLKLRTDSEVCYQPIVRVEKLDSEIEEKHTVKRTRSSPVLRRTNRPRRMPASPKSPRILRRPRGRWYREFY